MNKHYPTTIFTAAILIATLSPVACLAQFSAASNVTRWLNGGAPVVERTKISKDALSADPQKVWAVIVQFKTTSVSDQDDAIDSASGSVQRHFEATQAVAAHVSGAALQQLAYDPRVSYVSLDRPLSSSAAVQPISTNAEYTSEPINAPAVWSQGFDGSGIGVAIIDSGLVNLPDLGPKAGAAQRILYNASFPGGLPGGTQDSFGHGTHVAGLIAGNGNHSIGKQFTRTFTGVAPNANLVNLRVLDGNGQGTDSSVIAAIEAAISLKNTYNIRIINLSLGRPIWESYQLDPLCQAVEAAWKAGIVVVVAAGNDGRDQNLNSEGYGTINAPGNDPYVITVGAMNTSGTPAVSDDIVASYSSKGPSFIDQVAKPDIVAPGNLVTSLLKDGSTLQAQNPAFYTPKFFYQNNTGSSSSPDYTPLSGTSMATGVVSGAVALLLQAQPQLTPDQVKALLMRSAQRSFFPSSSTVIDPISGAHYTSHYDALTVGAGYLDIQATVANARSMSSTMPAGTAMSPIVSFDPITGDATLVTDTTALWGRNATFSASGVYGASAFVVGVSGSTALWGRTALWGKDDPSGFTALWGSTALWGRAAPDAATALWGKSSTGATGTLAGAMVTDAD